MRILLASLLVLLCASGGRAEQFGFRPGERLPVFTYFGPDQVRHTTAELAGRWFILKRGASWCAPCVAERPFVHRFTVDHSEVPILMGVVASGDGSLAARMAQMTRDIDFNAAHGWSGAPVIVLDGRTPSVSQLPAPVGFDKIPITIIVNPSGVVVRAWSPSDDYPDPARYHALAGKAVGLNEMLEAVLICAGTALPVATPAARLIATDSSFCGQESR